MKANDADENQCAIDEVWPGTAEGTVALVVFLSRLDRQTPRDRRSHKESPRGSLLGGIPAVGLRRVYCGCRPLGTR
jgi:hypothetical protein